MGNTTYVLIIKLITMYLYFPLWQKFLFFIFNKKLKESPIHNFLHAPVIGLTYTKVPLITKI